MVLDDDETVRHFIQTTLEIEGFRVRSGRDGRNIVEGARQFKPDLIISDMMMPNGGGFELVRALQGDPETAKIPVLLISGHGFDASTKAMFQQERNVTGFLEKPLRPNQFTSRVHTLLNTFTSEERIIRQRKNTDLDNERFKDLM